MLASLSAVLGLACLVAAGHDLQDARHNAHNHAVRHNSTLVKRQSFQGQATFFEVGLGACGQYSKDSDFMVALNAPQYGSGGYCGQTITISALGKTAQAVILDECPGCAYGSLDLSPGLFNYFTTPDAGVFQMTWWLGGGGSSGGNNDNNNNNNNAQQQTSTTPQWVPPTTTSTSTSTQHSTTSTTSQVPTTTSTSAAASSSSASSSGTETSTASAPSDTPTHANVNTGDNTQAVQGGGWHQQWKAVANLGYVASSARQTPS